ncbi:LysR substrate-binding domain-containing protein [uncultured Aquitalea sp.]|uniref:LysR substrate-binding domain-containing protein n=1 Tax=uncultured Aquitalea sp. TaxID=540272 RepID=UPI0025CDF089|nr:LysR substrate-binding domain-containing protein [uncultured Aquitalea sp.]
MSFRLPSLNAIRVFEAAARLGSFVQAADALCVTHGAISRQIRQLEEALGFSLFERRNRAVFLTPQGRRLFEASREALEKLDDCVRRLQREEAALPLVVSCEPTLAMRWLIPRLADFQARHPDCPLLISAAGGPVDLLRGEADVAIRRNDFHWGDDCQAEPLAAEHMGPVCRPELALAEAWSRACRLHSDTRPQAWERWARQAGREDTPLASVSYQHFYLSLQAAAAGLGVAMASRYMVEDDLASGRLLAPCGFSRDGSSYVLLRRRDEGDEPRVQRFLCWLQREFAASERLAEPG